MLAMARGLMSDPSLLIIDEPSLGLAPVVVNELFEILTQLKEGGRTIILVEQNTHRAVGVADHVYLMQGGKLALSQAADHVNLEQLHDLYFARSTGSPEINCGVQQQRLARQVEQQKFGCFGLFQRDQCFLADF